jgi:hypothetical protein
VWSFFVIDWTHICTSEDQRSDWKICKNLPR